MKDRPETESFLKFILSGGRKKEAGIIMKSSSVLRSAVLLGITLLTGGCLSGKSTAEIPAVSGFELPRYLGVWYEIARLPHRFERNMDRVTAEYTANPDGTVKVVNSGERDGERRKAEGIARFKGSSDLGELEVSFFRPFYGDYRIIRLAPDYRYAVVTSSTKEYLWILARTPQLPEEEQKELVEYAKSLGFTVEKLEFPIQDPAR